MDWIIESQAVIDDIKQDVQEISISKRLPVDDSGIYLNLTTLDGQKFCVKMSTAGFEIVAKEYNQDRSTDEESTIYETPYSMLSAISPMYTASFANRLRVAMEKITK